jgi:hypothetical protein
MDLTVAVASAGEDIDIQASTSVNITGQENAADSVVIESSAGGIDILASGAGAGEDIDITATGSSVNISATEDDAAAMTLTVNGGTSEKMVLTASQGTGADSVNVVSTAGGISVDATAGNGAGVLLLNSAVVAEGPTAFGAADETPDVSGHTYFETGGADTYTDFDAGAGSLTAGHIVIVESEHAATFDVTESGLKGGTTDLVTADGDITGWIYNGADWILLFFTDQSDDLS